MPEEKQTLHVEATVLDNKLVLRMAGASADLEDGRKVTIEPDLAGAGVCITITAADRKTWRMYHLNAEALGRAALEADAQSKLEADASNTAGPSPEA